MKAKFALEQAVKAQRERKDNYTFFNLGFGWSGWPTLRPGRFNSRVGEWRGEETRYPLYGRSGEPQCRSGQVPKILPLP